MAVNTTLKRLTLQSITKIVFFIVCLTVVLPLLAAQPASEAAQDVPTLEVFVRDACPHCAAAKAFLPEFSAQRPWLRIVLWAVDEDPAAREVLTHITRQAGLWPPGVPTFVYQNRVLIGFSTAQESGPELAAFVGERPANTSSSSTTATATATATATSSAPESKATATPSSATASAPQNAGLSSGSVDAGIFGTLSLARLGLPLFTLAVGLLDGFNPCAMWMLLFLLSLLVHLHDRRRMLLIAGTFVMVGAALYYAFMAAWLNIFMAVGMSAPVRTGLALLALFIAAVNIKDFFTFKAGFSLSIPESAKPKLYARVRELVQTRALSLALMGAAMLAIVANFIELLCTAGFPAMYTAVLAQQHLSPAAHYGYLGLYMVGYIADDSIMVGTAVMALSSQKLSENAGRWLKLVSGLVMLTLGGVMLLRPDWLF
jgi:glutaredoxin